jgi:adenine phosphoribosyltransferase
MAAMQFDYYFERVNKNTIGKYDITPIFADRDAFRNLIDDWERMVADWDFDTIVGIESLGYIIGSALAIRTNTRFVPVRKANKQPNVIDVTKSAPFVDYSGTEKVLEINNGLISKVNRVLIVDDWIETGAQVNAVIELVRHQGGFIEGITALNIDQNQKTSAALSGFTYQSIDHYCDAK